MGTIKSGLTDRFGRSYTPGARIIYPTRRGSIMELIEATVLATVTKRPIGSFFDRTTLVARRKNGTKVTLRNLWDVVVIPATR